jgi:disulfide bond formation protein DsbB
VPPRGRRPAAAAGPCGGDGYHSGMFRAAVPHPAPARAHAVVAPLLAAVGVGSLLALGAALVAQHAFGIEPCAWCVVQRLVVIAVAAVALAGAAIARRLPRGAGLPAAAALLALSVGGAVAAWHQHTVAAKQLSCAFTWADRTLMSLQLDGWAPGLFRVGATCADAAQSTLLGLPFEVWSGAWFAIVAVAATAAALAALRSA